MRIGLSQMNPTVGDLLGNAERVLSSARCAAEIGCDLLVTPELMLTGYPPQDLLFNPRFLQSQYEQIDRLSQTLPLPVLLGAVFPAAPTASSFDDELWQVATEGKGLISNAAIFISDGAVRSVARKALLPTYDVFDEWRYFRPGDPCTIQVAGQRIGVTICEDIWDTGYSRRPVAELVANGVDAIVNLSASPYHVGQFESRLAVLRRHALEHRIPLIYCNMVGGQDELVFDGRSMVCAADGEVVALAESWREELLQVQLPLEVHQKASWTGSPQDREGEIFAALAYGLREYMRKSGFATAVLGLSGGVDSALVACIACSAVGPDNVTGVAMPGCYTADYSTSDAAELARRLGIGFAVLPIQDSVDLAENRFQAAFGSYQRSLTRENLQARERGKTLMEFSNDKSALLLATGNKTEYALGYSTMYGDMCGGIAVIGDLNKLEVYALARWFNEKTGRETIPRRILQRAPSAELAAQQVDPFDYSVIAPLTDLIVEGQQSIEQLIQLGFAEGDVRQVLSLVRRSEFKRKQAAPILRVSPKSFGIGRRMPIVNVFES
jgi:NAD+ synthetase